MHIAVQSNMQTSSGVGKMLEVVVGVVVFCAAIALLLIAYHFHNPERCYLTMFIAM